VKDYLDHHLRQAEADLQLARGSVEQAIRRATGSTNSHYLSASRAVLLGLEKLFEVIRRDTTEPDHGTRDTPPGSSER
jgi:hypothetical protein